MAIFADLELERILHEKRDFLTDPDYSYEDKLKDNAKDVKDARDRYINPLQISDWLCVTSKGVVPGFKAYESYRLFVKKIK